MSPSYNQHAHHPPFKRLRALVIDHTLEMRLHLIHLLFDVSIQIAGETGDHTLAIPLIQQTQPDLILLEVHHPSAAEFFRAVGIIKWCHQHDPQVQIIALTLFADSVFTQQCLHWGAHWCLDKTQGWNPLIILMKHLSQQHQNRLKGE